jgi:hypothetical protein
MLFISNKYYQWYNNIVQRASLRKHISGYTEKHHIIPKSLGGSNDSDNMVVLTAREHFICHLLLPKIVTHGKEKMLNALWRMLHPRHNRYKINSHTYSNAKKEFSLSKCGIARSVEVCEKMSQGRKGKGVGKDNGFFGKTHTEDTINKMKLAASKRKRRVMTEETRQKLSKSNKGQFVSDETKRKQSLAKQGKPWSETRKLAGRKVMTPGGVFNSISEAERQLGLGAGVVRYRIKTQPDNYYIIKGKE